MADKETVIGNDTQIVGEIRGEGSLQVRGRVEGKIQVADSVTISSGAIVKADVEARVVDIAGVLVGNVVASERIRLGDKARVVGDLNAPRVGIEGGAQYRGRVEMGQAEASHGRAAGATVSASGQAKAPPRMISAAEAASGADTRSLPPRVASVPVRANVSAPVPAWARKKAKRR